MLLPSSVTELISKEYFLITKLLSLYTFFSSNLLKQNTEPCLFVIPQGIFYCKLFLVQLSELPLSVLTIGRVKHNNFFNLMIRCWSEHAPKLLHRGFFFDILCIHRMSILTNCNTTFFNHGYIYFSDERSFVNKL